MVIPSSRPSPTAIAKPSKVRTNVVQDWAKLLLQRGRHHGRPRQHIGGDLQHDAAQFPNQQEAADEQPRHGGLQALVHAGPRCLPCWPDGYGSLRIAMSGRNLSVKTSAGCGTAGRPNAFATVVSELAKRSARTPP